MTFAAFIDRKTQLSGRSGFDPGRSPLAAWLTGIAKNAITDVHNRRARDRRDQLAVAVRTDPAPEPETAGVADRVTFVRKDIHEVDFSPATVLAFYLLSDTNVELRPKMLAQAAQL